jgi:hypothetical protein
VLVSHSYSSYDSITRLCAIAERRQRNGTPLKLCEGTNAIGNPLLGVACWLAVATRASHARRLPATRVRVQTVIAGTNQERRYRAILAFLHCRICFLLQHDVPGLFVAAGASTDSSAELNGRQGRRGLPDANGVVRRPGLRHAVGVGLARDATPSRELRFVMGTQRIRISTTRPCSTPRIPPCRRQATGPHVGPVRSWQSAFWRTISAFRCSPCNFARFIGDLRNAALNAS